MRLKTASTSKLVTPRINSTYHALTTRTGMDTSMEATASLYQSGPSKFKAPNPSVRAAPLLRATTTSFISGISSLALPVLVLPVPRLLVLFLLLCPKPRQPAPVPAVVQWPTTELVANRCMHRCLKNKSARVATVCCCSGRRLIIKGLC